MRGNELTAGLEEAFRTLESVVDRTDLVPAVREVGEISDLCDKITAGESLEDDDIEALLKAAEKQMPTPSTQTEAPDGDH